MSRAHRLFAPASILTLAVLAAWFGCVGTSASAANFAVTTQHNDNLRTGSNTQETILTPANVTEATFGKLFTIQLDANVNGQPLYVPNVMIGGVSRNVLVAYTSNNSNGSPCSLWAVAAKNGATIWQHTFTNSAEWTTCTPVIDTTAGIVYVVTKDTNDDGNTSLRAISLTTGAELPGSPIVIAATVSGTGDGSSGGMVSFTTSHANERPGLLLLNGIVYIAFAHNSDSFPYHGWIFGYQYNGSKFTQTGVFCTDPNGGDGGVWMAGQGMLADANGYIYAASGNGTFDVNTGGIDYGMCYLKLSTPSLQVVSWMAPYDESTQSNGDYDLAGGGLTGIPDTTALFAGGTKFGTVFLLNSSSLGGFTPGGPDNVLDRLDGVSNGSVGENPACWHKGGNSYIYLWPAGDPLEEFRYTATAGKLDPAGIYKSTSNSTAGGGLSVSSNGSADAIVWGQGADGIVRAYRGTDVSQPELWDSNMNSSRDGLGGAGHFQWITISNGKVYVPNGSAQIVVYGLLK